MGLEILSDVPHASMETVADGEDSLMHGKENGVLSERPCVNESIKFGSHTMDELSKEPGIDVSEANLPKNAVDEWPEPKRTHNFYFVRYRSYDDPQLKAKFDFADKEIQMKNKDRLQVTDALKAKRSERANVISQLKSLTADDRQFRMAVDEKRREMEPLQDALGKLRGSNNAGKDRGIGLCSSEHELDDLIESLNDRIQHESISLKEEKQIIRDISQLQGTRKNVIANAAMRAKIQESLGQRDDIQDQVKLMGVDLVGAKKEKQAIRAKIVSLEDELDVIDNGIKSLQVELELVTEKRNKSYENLQDLKKQRDGGNAHFFQNRTLLNLARELAARKNISSLNDLYHTEMETFMSRWSSTKAFRDDYEKRILKSLDSRELSRDGRMRNPNEKPLMAAAENEVIITKPTEKKHPLSKEDNIQDKTREDAVNTTTSKVITKPAIARSNDAENKETKGMDTNSDPVIENVKEVEDPEKAREKKREEEIAKGRLALERKKRMAEKAALKAAARAQKEAEKKLKEREKKAAKKAAVASVITDDLPEEAAATAIVEPEKVVSPKKTGRIRNNPRERRGSKTSSGMDMRPRFNSRRKKTVNYWVWGGAGAAFLLAALFLVLGYVYLV